MAVTDQELKFPDLSSSVDEAKSKDTAWCMLRCLHDENDILEPRAPQMVPGWSGFNAVVSRSIPVPSVVGYCPVIDAHPTELSTLLSNGKKQAFHLVESDPDLCNAMKLVGSSFDDDEDRQQGCARFVCSLYGYIGDDIDIVRYTLFCSKNAQTCHLPPTKDSLRYHVTCANYQAHFWQQSLEAKSHTASPDGHGWDLIDRNLSIHWMDQQPAPMALLQLQNGSLLRWQVSMSKEWYARY
jgi:hypothetical protein